MVGQILGPGVAGRSFAEPGGFGWLLWVSVGGVDCCGASMLLPASRGREVGYESAESCGSRRPTLSCCPAGRCWCSSRTRPGPVGLTASDGFGPGAPVRDDVRLDGGSGVDHRSCRRSRCCCGLRSRCVRGLLGSPGGATAGWIHVCFDLFVGIRGLAVGPTPRPALPMGESVAGAAPAPWWWGRWVGCATRRSPAPRVSRQRSTGPETT
jgi:hypothetical protein